MQTNKIKIENEEEKSLLTGEINTLLKDFQHEHTKTHKNLIENISLKKSKSSEYFLMLLTNLISFLFILPILSGFFTTSPNEIVIIESLGKPIKIIKTPGLHWYYPCLNTFKRTNKALTTTQLKGSSVPDLGGSPLEISVVITYSIQDALAATYNIKDELNFLETQALEVVRRVISKFNYRSNDSKEVTLIKDSMVLGKYMRELLNIKMKMAGIFVSRMELMEICYHTEIAQGMLQVQQANAKVMARREIVRGGVEIVRDALAQLESNGIRLTEENKEDLTKNLMIVVCSDVGRPQPVLNVQ